MSYTYQKYPNNVKNLATEIKNIIDDYYARNINAEELEAILVWFSKKCATKLYKGNDDFNPTIKKIIGKQRITLLNSILEDN